MNVTTFNEFNENNKNKMFNNLDELFDAYNITKINWKETDIDDFAHSDPIDDFDDYFINDNTVKIEVEIVCLTQEDEEIWIYTDKNDNIHGWAFNID